MSVIPAELRETSDNPCPPWCACEPGHGYEATTLDDRKRLIRYHTGHQTQLSLAVGGTAGVEIATEESADRKERDVRLSAPAVQLWATGELTVHEALSLSDMLARAAMELRKIEAGQ